MLCYSITKTGNFEIRQEVTLAISANQARHLVNHFLSMDMSTMPAVETPDLVIDERTVWRALV